MTSCNCEGGDGYSEKPVKCAYCVEQEEKEMNKAEIEAAARNLADMARDCYEAYDPHYDNCRGAGHCVHIAAFLTSLLEREAGALLWEKDQRARAENYANRLEALIKHHNLENTCRIVIPTPPEGA